MAFVIKVPETKVIWEPITLSDTHPTTGLTTTFTFPRKMTAAPLTSNGGIYTGSGPDGKALWWPSFQERHKAINGGKLWWVQGHMLNDNVHGPGVPGNLVPISGVLNTNMEALVEGGIKKWVAAGKALVYVVEAHWEGAANRKDGNTGAAFHPEEMRKTYGLKDGGGSLLWGEQFAPTRLSWQVWFWNTDPITGQLLSTPIINPFTMQPTGQTPDLVPIASAYKGSIIHYDPSQWMNHFPV